MSLPVAASGDEPSSPELMFLVYVQEAVRCRSYVRIIYKGTLGEVLWIDALPKALVQEGDNATLCTASGEQIPVKQIVFFNGVCAPNFAGYTDFTCDC